MDTDYDARTLKQQPRGFMPSTRTSLVRRAQAEDPERARAALGELCLAYWQPVHVFICRWSSWSAAEAADLTQAFMASLLASGVAGYQSTHGGRRSRFRNWLLRAVKNFLLNERERRHAARRDERRSVAIEAFSTGARLAIEPRHTHDPERMFRSSFAACVIDRAWHSTRAAYQARGNVARFDLLERYIPGDEIADLEYEAAGAVLGISVGAVRAAVMDMRLRFQANVRRHLRELVGSNGGVDHELRCLFGDQAATEQS